MEIEQQETLPSGRNNIEKSYNNTVETPVDSGANSTIPMNNSGEITKIEKPIKAIALCRVSTKAQFDDGNIAPQEQRILLAANVLNAEIVEWWRLAVSSRKGKNLKRKDLLEMLAFCKRYKSIKYLIIDEPDRFMRSISEYYWWKVEFQRAGVQLRFANRPEVDPEEDRAVFDELIDVYRAESSNNERIDKTPEKMMAKIRAGYYPHNPKLGYRTTDIPGLHEPDEPNWSALRDTLKEMAAGEYGISEGLKRVTERGLRTKNYGPRAVGGKPVDMYRWRDLVRDGYYCGEIKMNGWDVINENGLHKKMITVAEHRILVALADNKGKRFVVNRNNPTFIMSNEMECEDCLKKNEKYPRLVGYTHNNGQAGKRRKYYERYRCRCCNINILQGELHSQIDNVLNDLALTDLQKNKLQKHLKKAWATYEQALVEKAIIAEGRLKVLKDKKSELIVSLSQNPDLATDIKEEIEKKKLQIEEAESVALQARDFERDFLEFVDFAIDYVNSWKKNWWLLDKETLRQCKQILFPSGMVLTADKKVYTPEISLVYTYEDNKKAPEEADFSTLEGPVGLEPTTPCLKGRCSNQLSYGPVIFSLTESIKSHTNYQSFIWLLFSYHEGNNSLHYLVFCG